VGKCKSYKEEREEICTIDRSFGTDRWICGKARQLSRGTKMRKRETTVKETKLTLSTTETRGETDGTGGGVLAVHRNDGVGIRGTSKDTKKKESRHVSPKDRFTTRLRTVWVGRAQILAIEETKGKHNIGERCLQNKEKPEAMEIALLLECFLCRNR